LKVVLILALIFTSTPLDHSIAKKFFVSQHWLTQNSFHSFLPLFREDVGPDEMLTAQELWTVEENTSTSILWLNKALEEA